MSDTEKEALIAEARAINEAFLAALPENLRQELELLRTLHELIADRDGMFAAGNEGLVADYDEVRAAVKADPAYETAMEASGMNAWFNKLNEYAEGEGERATQEYLEKAAARGRFAPLPPGAPGALKIGNP